MINDRVMGLIWIIVILIICPVLIGRLAMSKLSLEGKLAASVTFPLGFFLELTLLEFLAFPFACLHLKTSLLTVVYTGILIALSVISLLTDRPQKIKLYRPKTFEWIYLAGFTVIFAWLLYKAVTLDFTYMSYDDYAYVTIANDAAYSDRLFVIRDVTGVAERLNVHRAMQTSLIFPAILSILSGISVITIEHCILQVFFLILAYTAYYYMSEVLYESFEDRMVFLLLISMLYIFGYHSKYNTSFRLLMPDYQGKAVLAVSLTPLLFAMMTELLRKDYDRNLGITLMLLSAAAVSLTLLGAVAIFAFVSIPVCLSMFSKKRNLKHLLYIPLTGVLPAVFAGILIIYRFAL